MEGIQGRGPKKRARGRGLEHLVRAHELVREPREHLVRARVTRERLAVALLNELDIDTLCKTREHATDDDEHLDRRDAP